MNFLTTALSNHHLCVKLSPLQRNHLLHITQHLIEAWMAGAYFYYSLFILGSFPIHKPLGITNSYYFVVALNFLWQEARDPGTTTVDDGVVMYDPATCS